MRKALVPALLISVLAAPALCFADTAQVLPKGRFGINGTFYYYFDINERYDPDGDVEDIDVDYNTDLNSLVFPALSPLDPFVGGTASVGSSVVDFTFKYRWFEFAFDYGLMDKLTLGILIPVNYSKNEVETALDTSTANVGKNSFANTLAPLGTPGTVPLTEDDVQGLLGDGVDINGDGNIDVPGFGYDRVETWSDWGVGDIELGGKYQFYNASPWRSAVFGGVRLPSGDVDDPDNLQDIGFGDGQTDILLRLFIDYLGVPNLLLNGTFHYEIQLPDSEVKRVLQDVNFPLTRDKEEVDRNLGDIIEVEFAGDYAFDKRWSSGLSYTYFKKFKDDIDGDLGFNYEALEEETDPDSHMVKVNLGYSTVQAYLDKESSVPVATGLTYRYRFAGSNNVTKSQYISLDLSFYF